MTQKEIKKNKKHSISEKLFNSHAVNSLRLETLVYDSFKKLNWKVQHSPYYEDAETKKFREIDITARKYWTSSALVNLRCDVNFVVECKSLTDYHIVVSNRLENKIGENLIHCWIGNDCSTNYRKVIEILIKNDIGNDKINYIIKKLNTFCYPNSIFRFCNCRLDAFDIPIFNSFRETNIGNTKELDNSVVWKAFQSLYSCIEKYHEFIWGGIDYFINDIENKKLTHDEKSKELLDSLIEHARYLTYIHPLLVVESNLWEITKTGMRKLKFFRLIFQKKFEEEIWIDIVNKEYLQEYLQKTLQYDKFLRKKRFKLN